MQIIWDILVESSEYFSMVAGIMGILLFVIMLFSLDILRGAGKLFNNSYSVKNMEDTVNKTTSIEKFIYSRSRFIGAIVICATIYIFIFLMRELDLERIMSVLKVRSTFRPFTLALMQTARLFSIISMAFAFLFGIVMVFDKNSAEKISDFLNDWYSTEEIENKLNETVLKDTDTICFLHNKFFGILGLLASLILRYFAIMKVIGG